MHKRFLILACSAVLVCSLGFSAVAAPTSQPAPATPSATGVDVTGTQWSQSTQNEKLAFLYGASSIVAIEQLIAQQQGKEPSPFVKAWVSAFKETRWPDLQKKLDGWYTQHPEQAKRHIFDVLWFEFMAPVAGK